MHSPIVYIVENENGLFKDMNYRLDEDLLPCEEYLDECLVESDWHEVNTLDNPTWHRGNWPLDKVMKMHHYLEFKEIDDQIKFSINKKNIIDWDKAINELLETYMATRNRKLENNEIFTPFNDLEFEDYFAFEDKIGKAHGGTAFILYKEYEGELELYGVFKERDLIEYCKDQMIMKNKDEIEFDVCLNTTGDYHY